MAIRVLSAILFYPRGGSAHAARALAHGLRASGLQVTLVAGSRRDIADARRFYGDVRAVEFDAALASEDPLGYEDVPMHPSYEDRPGAPDRVFAALDDAAYERQVAAWARELERAGAREADVLHLHHLTPLNEAAARVAPEVPVIGQLHGTELLMLERIAAGAPAGWRYADRWAARMRAWAARCARLVVSPAGLERAGGLLGVGAEKLVPLSGGVDLELFSPRPLDRHAFWRRVLVERPRGWRPGAPPGSVRYSEPEADALAAATTLLYVGRFTAVKRLDELIAAFAQATSSATRAAGLVLVGGHPGEWEDEHPAEIVARLSVSGVYLAGWYSHAELPDFYRASDAVVSASEREQFGQTLVEGMACGLPAIATRSFGPELILEPGVTGWLAGDRAELAAAFAQAIEDEDARRRRGAAARQAACERFSWRGIAAELAAVIEDVLADSRCRAAAIGA
jgi:glycosyltransferase involved in cell wall biosynthesis